MRLLLGGKHNKLLGKPKKDQSFGGKETQEATLGKSGCCRAHRGNRLPGEKGPSSKTLFREELGELDSRGGERGSENSGKGGEALGADRGKMQRGMEGVIGRRISRRM